METARRPLAGRRLAVLRGKEQAEPLRLELERLGASVLVAPLWRVEAAEDRSALLEAAANVGRYDWVVFTSANGVSAFFDALEDAGVEESAWKKVRFAAVGPATARALARRGAAAEVMAGEHRAEGLVEALAARGVACARVLFPRAQEAREVLAEGLRAAGAHVDDVVAYRLVRESVDPNVLRELASPGMDGLILTSPSSVRFLKMACDEAKLPWPVPAKCFCIGPVTEGAARGGGLFVAAVAPRYTTAGLVDALVEYFSAAGPTEV